MPTNIDRLHKAIEIQKFGGSHRSGKTTIMIHQLAGQIQVGGHEDIHVQIKYYRDLAWLLPMTMKIFREQGIETIEVNRNKWIVCYNDHKVWISFFTMDSLSRNIESTDTVDIDFVDHGDNEPHIANYLEEIKCVMNLYIF